jgi:hypothetical protein
METSSQHRVSTALLARERSFGWVGPRTGLNDMENIIFLKPVASRYIDCVIPALFLLLMDLES